MEVILGEDRVRWSVVKLTIRNGGDRPAVFWLTIKVKVMVGGWKWSAKQCAVAVEKQIIEGNAAYGAIEVHQSSETG